MKVKLSCPEGFKYEGWNRVQVDIEPPREFSVVVLSNWLNELNSDPPGIFPSTDCLFIYGAESFSMEDLVEAIQDVADHNGLDYEVRYDY